MKRPKISSGLLALKRWWQLGRVHLHPFANSLVTIRLEAAITTREPTTHLLRWAQNPLDVLWLVHWQFQINLLQLPFFPSSQLQFSPSIMNLAGKTSTSFINFLTLASNIPFSNSVGAIGANWAHNWTILVLSIAFSSSVSSIKFQEYSLSSSNKLSYSGGGTSSEHKGRIAGEVWAEGPGVTCSKLSEIDSYHHSVHKSSLNRRPEADLVKMIDGQNHLKV